MTTAFRIASYGKRMIRTPHQHGLTMIELMIAMALGLFVLLAAIGLLLSSRAGYTAQDQTAHVQETGRYAMEILTRAVRQAGHENWNDTLMPVLASAELTANVIGMDAMTLKKATAGLDAAESAGTINGSDVLALRFFGDETNEEEGTILNCAGLAVPSPTASGNAEEERGWSIFFVAKDSAGEPELRCKYRSKTGWNADAIARGVESFQVLYGVDTDHDGLPDGFMNADAIDRLDESLSLSGDNAIARATDMNRKTYWKAIRAIRISLLVRSELAARDDALSDEYSLFGKAYADMHAERDKGVHIREREMPAATRNRIRKIFAQTIQMRNDVAGSGA